MDVTIIDPDGDRLVPSDSGSSYSGNSSDGDGDSFRSLGYIKVTTTGTYTVSVDGPPGSSVRIGEIPLARTLALLFGGIAVGTLGFIVALVILIVALVRRSKVKKANRALASGGAPGAPPAYGQQPPPYGQAAAAGAAPAACARRLRAAGPARPRPRRSGLRRLRPRPRPRHPASAGSGGADAPPPAPPAATPPPPPAPPGSDPAASGADAAGPSDRTRPAPAEPGRGEGRRTVACGAMADLAATIEEIWNNRESLAADDADANAAIGEAIDLLDRGEARVAEVGADGERRRPPVAEAGDPAALPPVARWRRSSSARSSTPTRSRSSATTQAAGVRVVPGRLGPLRLVPRPGVVMMPSYVNIGARVGRRHDGRHLGHGRLVRADRRQRAPVGRRRHRRRARAAAGRAGDRRRRLPDRQPLHRGRGRPGGRRRRARRRRASSPARSR